MIKQLCTFSVDDLRLGVDVSKVHEIIKIQEVTDVPLAPTTVSGLLNLRGQILMIVDLKRMFSLSFAKIANPIFIILKSEEGPVGYKVDKVGEVLEINDKDIMPIPNQLHESIRNCSSGVYTTPDGLIVELISEKMTEILN